ncbi:UNVERIFIED_CONTAM: hypothetical protein RMT77_016817 [Armadillidium vulgare]
MAALSRRGGFDRFDPRDIPYTPHLSSKYKNNNPDEVVNKNNNNINTVNSAVTDSVNFNIYNGVNSDIHSVLKPGFDSGVTDYQSDELPDSVFNVSDERNFISSYDNTIQPWMFTSQEECDNYHYRDILTNTFDQSCNATWDNMMCWPPTPKGETATLKCPPLRGVDITKSAYRICNPEGYWLNKSGRATPGVGWTNYTACFMPDVRTLLNKLYSGSEEDAQMKYLVAKNSRAVEIVGLILSLISLLLSLLIFSYVRKLYNNRTRIHRNQFVAMLLQVVVRLVLYVDQAVLKGDSTGLASFVVVAGQGIDNTPIICESFYILLEYGRSAMFMWMFIEAMYLNNLISVAFFQGPSDYKVYYLIGWGIPVIMTSLWAIVMSIWGTKDICWFGYSFTTFYWILEGPRFIVIGANLLFLLNIMRILLSKLREASTLEASQIRPLRKSVRNALFLLPLLGITNAVTMIPKPLERSAFEFGIWSYSTNLLTSFQGFVVACIYCFFNADVKRSLCYFWKVKLTLRPDKIKTTNNHHSKGAYIIHKDGLTPRLYYKARSKSSGGDRQGSYPQLNKKNLFEAHSVAHDRHCFDHSTQGLGPPFLVPTTSL